MFLVRVLGVTFWVVRVRSENVLARQNLYKVIITGLAVLLLDLGGWCRRGQGTVEREPKIGERLEARKQQVVKL